MYSNLHNYCVDWTLVLGAYFLVQHITTLACAFSCSLSCRVQVSARGLWMANNEKKKILGTDYIPFWRAQDMKMLLFWNFSQNHAITRNQSRKGPQRLSLSFLQLRKHKVQRKEGICPTTEIKLKFPVGRLNIFCTTLPPGRAQSTSPVGSGSKSDIMVIQPSSRNLKETKAVVIF